jgi:hypothetical protein
MIKPKLSTCKHVKLSSTARPVLKSTSTDSPRPVHMAESNTNIIYERAKANPLGVEVPAGG